MKQIDRPPRIPVLSLVLYQGAVTLVLLFFLGAAGYALYEAERARERGQAQPLLVPVALLFLGLGVGLWALLTILVSYRVKSNVGWLLWRIGMQESPDLMEGLPHPGYIDLSVQRIDQLADQRLLRYAQLCGKVLVHEVGNHLRPLRDDLKALRGASLPEQKEKQDRLESSIDRALQHFDDLRSWLQGDFTALHTEVNLGTLVGRILDNLAEGQLARAHFVRRCTVEPRVRGLNKLLEAVANNLIRNAFAHNDENAQVTILLTAPAGPDGAWATLCVEDTGRRLTEDEQSRIFLWFKDSPLHGIGLPLSRAMVRSLGGRLDYQDEMEHTREGRTKLWQGKAFCVHLPLAPPRMGERC